MNATRRAALLAAAVVMVLSVTVSAANNATLPKSPDSEQVSITEHVLHTPGGRIKYRATAGMLPLAGEDGKKQADIFYVAYARTDTKAGPRPVTFAFNGGPGSSSVWLHFGAVGPRRLRLLDDGQVPPPPPQLDDNPETWLAFTDLVFIDPVGTGYSRAAEAEKNKEFYDFKCDIASVSDFIRLYCTRFGRWLSPKFILGESYGTTRAVGVAEELHERHGIEANGLVLVSPVLDFNTIRFDSGNNLPYMLFLPTYAATALQHGRLADPKTAAGLLPAAERWAVEEYSVLLARGNSLSEAEQRAAAARIAALTGLSPGYVLQNRLRIPARRFRKALLRDDGLVIGRMDARFTGPDPDAAAEAGAFDPSLEMLTGAFAGAVNHYVRAELGFKSDLPYEFLNSRVSAAWKWQAALRGGQGYVQVSDSLADIMHINPHLKVFMAAGEFDLATPYFAVQYTIDQLPLAPGRAANITLHRYPAGHMMYTSRDVLQRLTADVRGFYQLALPAGR